MHALAALLSPICVIKGSRFEYILFDGKARPAFVPWWPGEAARGGPHLVTFSVLMPAYNHERFVAEAIESVLGQTFFDLELIVIDDASRDSTPAIVKRYAEKDHRVRAYFHHANRGISRTLNEALELATGRFVAVINSDDLWMPEKLRRQWEILRENEDVVVWTEGALVDAEGRRTGKTFTAHYGAEKKRKGGDIFQELVAKNYVLHSSIAVRREAMERIGYDETLRYNNDFRLFLDLAAERLYRFIPEELVGYRVHGGNAIYRHTKEWEDDYIRLYAYVLDRYGDRLDGALKAMVYLYLCRLYDRRGMRSNALRLLSRAISLDPGSTALLYKALNLCDGLRRCEHFWALDARGSDETGHAVAGPRGIEGRRKFRSAGSDEVAAAFASGLEHALRGEHAEALAVFERVLEKDPGAVGAWVNVAIIRSMSGDAEGALSCVAAALRVGGLDAQAWYNRGVILDREGRLGEAAACFERAISILKEGTDALMLAAAHIGLGACRAGMGSYGDAVACMEKALRVDPLEGRALFNLAFCLELDGRLEEAVEAYEQAARLSRESRWEELRKGLCLRGLGRVKEAARCFDSLLRRDPKDDEAWLERGNCCRLLGKAEKALACYEKALDANGDNAEAWRLRGSLLAEMGKSEEALGCFREALRLDARDPEILASTAAVCVETGRYVEAEGLFRRALEEDAADIASWLGLGVCKEEAGDLEGALECVEEAIVRDPQAAEAWNERGNVLSRLGAMEEARQSYLRALELDEELPEAWYNLAAAEEELGNRDAAASALRSFIEKASPEWTERVEDASRLLRAWQTGEAFV